VTWFYYLEKKRIFKENSMPLLLRESMRVCQMSINMEGHKKHTHALKTKCFFSKFASFIKILIFMMILDEECLENRILGGKTPPFSLFNHHNSGRILETSTNHRIRYYNLFSFHDFY
jgi:hypothetical protein